jgi:hypothetical protein
MCGKKLTLNLQNYLSPIFNIPVYSFDRNRIKEVPCIVVGYDSEESSIKGAFGHYTVGGRIQVVFQGYDDPDTLEADDTADEVIEALCSPDLNLSVNYPETGTDTRPVSGFGMHQLIVRGVTREDEDHSTLININFEAFCVAKDFR